MKALYRKYRPCKLSEVVGQEQVTKGLKNSLEAGRVSHAYLFIGPRGTGKTSVARILAHEVNGFSYELEDDYVDIVEIDGASNRGIDDIRDLREKAVIAPTAGKYKVYIIDEVHMLTKEAFNALLKTLEEPPEHVIFIMATTDAYKVPVTITSRAQVCEFRLADTEKMVSHLKMIAEKEKLAITEGALRVVAKRGGGSFRDSLSLLDQVATLSDGSSEITEEMVVSAMGLPGEERIRGLLETYLSGDVVKITTMLRESLSSGTKATTLAEEMIGYIIENPRAELMMLLGKLTEVKEPFAEARLLLALTDLEKCERPKMMTEGPKMATERPKAMTVSPEQKMAKPVEKVVKPVEAEKEVVKPAEAPAPVAKQEPKGPTGEFSWEGLLEATAGVSEVVHSQLKKCKYEFKNGELLIYPKTKIIQNILSNPNNKRILDGAGGNVVKITILEAGTRRGGENDGIMGQISAIMGGEVEVFDEGGSDPF